MKRASVASHGRDGAGTNRTPSEFGAATGYSSRTPNIPVSPETQISAAFDQQQRQLETQTPDEPLMLNKQGAAHKLHARLTFQGLLVSIETGKGRHRHWHDPHTGEGGKTKMRYPYGYIRRTKGMDGDHVDVVIGPKESAENVFVFMINKAPDFIERDEEKCFLGFDSKEKARSVFDSMYDDKRFFRSVKTMPFETFKKRVLATFDGSRDKVGEVTHGTGVVDLKRDSAAEKGLGYPDVGTQRFILGEPKDSGDRISSQFDGMDDISGNSTAIEGAWGAPAGNPEL